MVMNHVQQYSQAPEMTGLDKCLKPVRAAIADVFRRKRLRQVVTPTGIPGKFRNRHYFDRIHSQALKVVKFIGGRHKLAGV